MNIGSYLLLRNGKNTKSNKFCFPHTLLPLQTRVRVPVRSCKVSKFRVPPPSPSASSFPPVHFSSRTPDVGPGARPSRHTDSDTLQGLRLQEALASFNLFGVNNALLQPGNVTHHSTGLLQTLLKFGLRLTCHAIGSDPFASTLASLDVVRAWNCRFSSRLVASACIRAMCSIAVSYPDSYGALAKWQPTGGPRSGEVTQREHVWRTRQRRHGPRAKRGPGDGSLQGRRHHAPPTAGPALGCSALERRGALHPEPEQGTVELVAPAAQLQQRR